MEKPTGFSVCQKINFKLTKNGKNRETQAPPVKKQ
jgi:hypothetical protein